MKQKKGLFVRGLLFLVAIICFVWFFLPLMLSVQLNIGNATGMTVTVALLFYALFMPNIHGMVRKWKQEKKWLYFSLFGILFFITALVVLESICMIWAATKTPEPKATVVVLGCRVYGERASLSLQERLEAAYEYLLKQEDAVCILSGGQGEGENISEAECMYRYLVAKGIAPERLYKEESSTNTRENLLYARQLIEEQGLCDKIAIATSEYHQYRAGQIAKSLDLEYGAVSGHTVFWLFPTYYVRELYAILYEWIF